MNKLCFKEYSPIRLICQKMPYKPADLFKNIVGICVGKPSYPASFILMVVRDETFFPASIEMPFYDRHFTTNGKAKAI